MRRFAAIAGIAVAATGAGLALAVAQDDPIGAMISGKETPPPVVEAEAPPPAPAETPKTVAPIPEPKVKPKVTAPPPAKKEEVVIVQSRRPRYPIAILQAMDKITAESIRFEVRVDKPVSYKGLVFTLKACETTAADEPVRDAIANLEIGFRGQATSTRRAPPVRQVYRGWMFAASPSVSPLEHPVYDAWLIACKADGPLQPAVLTAPAVTPTLPVKASVKTGSPAAAKAKAKVDVVPPPAAAVAPEVTVEPRPEPKEAPKAADSIPLY